MLTGAHNPFSVENKKKRSADREKKRSADRQRLGDAWYTQVSPSCFDSCVEVDLSHQDRPECACLTLGPTQIQKKSGTLLLVSVTHTEFLAFLLHGVAVCCHVHVAEDKALLPAALQTRRHLATVASRRFV